MIRQTPTWVEVDLKAIAQNCRRLKARFSGSVGLLATVKSDAYGHGLVPVARTLARSGASWLGVGTVDEGIALRRAGIKKPIVLLLGLIEGNIGEIVRHRLHPVVFDSRSLDLLDTVTRRLRRRVTVHVKIDTGMTRLGIRPDQADRFFDRLARCRFVVPGGLMTHLADAGSSQFTSAQFRRFRPVLNSFRTRFPAGSVAHIANSLAGIDRRILGVKVELVRFGIALYGAYPVRRQARLVRLTPALSWKTRIISVKTVPSGTFVSYGRTARTRRPSRIGVLPVGYADGYRRCLSNRAWVLIRGRRAPVIGTVCMDMSMVDLTGVPGARIGDEVVLIGRQGRREIRAEELARLAGTISYEIFCGIAQRVPRILAS